MPDREEGKLARTTKWEGWAKIYIGENKILASSAMLEREADSAVNEINQAVSPLIQSERQDAAAQERQKMAASIADDWKWGGSMAK